MLNFSTLHQLNHIIKDAPDTELAIPIVGDHPMGIRLGIKDGRLKCEYEDWVKHRKYPKLAKGAFKFNYMMKVLGLNERTREDHIRALWVEILYILEGCSDD